MPVDLSNKETSFIKEENSEPKQLELLTVAAPTVPGRFINQEKPTIPLFTKARDKVET